jgi:3-methyladenine DNA glycosylase AlkD
MSRAGSAWDESPLCLTTGDASHQRTPGANPWVYILEPGPWAGSLWGLTVLVEDGLSYEEILEALRKLSNPLNVVGMAQFGINPHNTLGVPVFVLRKMAKTIGHDHGLAARLFESGIHESRILASMVDDPSVVKEQQMEEWVQAFDSWDVCDQCCSNLFDRTPFAWTKAVEWSVRPEVFVKRAAFVMMATLAVHDKKAADLGFVRFLEIIRRESADERNFVKKAINWALRQIGKRSMILNELAVAAAEEIRGSNVKGTRWIAGNALKELKSDSVRRRLAEKPG